jgi:hypothetical protein
MPGIGTRAPADWCHPFSMVDLRKSQSKQQKTRRRILAARRARVLHRHCPSGNRGRSEDRALAAPAASCAVRKAHELVTTGSTKTSGLPCAMVLTLLRALPGVRDLIVTVACKSSFANLAPAQGRQDHTTWPSASCRARRTRCRRPSRPAPNTRDDREAPLLEGAGRAYDKQNFRQNGREIFLATEPKTRTA